VFWLLEIEVSHPLSPRENGWVVVIISEIHFNPKLEQFCIENIL
jgi:hypothetical protein